MSDNEKDLSSIPKGGNFSRGEGDRESIILEFENFREFLSEYSAHICERGVFIRTETPREVGSFVDFEVRLSDRFRLVQARGAVVWVVPLGSMGRESGMAVEFEQIDEPSRRLIGRLVSNFRNEGGEAFDLEPPKEAFDVGASREVPDDGWSPTKEPFGDEPFQLPTHVEAASLPVDLLLGGEGSEAAESEETTAEEDQAVGEDLERVERAPESRSPVVVPGFVEGQVPPLEELTSPSEPAVLPELPAVGESGAAASVVEPGDVDEVEILPSTGDDLPLPLAAPEEILETAELEEYDPGLPDAEDAFTAEGKAVTLPDISDEIDQLTPEQGAAEETGEEAPPIEMPEPGEVEGEYAPGYIAEGESETGRGRRVWLVVCLIALGLGGAAALRYQERLREFVPWLPGSGERAQTAEGPALDELRARLTGRAAEETEDAGTAAAEADGLSLGEADESQRDGDVSGADESSAVGDKKARKKKKRRSRDAGPDASKPAAVKRRSAREATTSVDAGPQTSIVRITDIAWKAQSGSTIVTVAVDGGLSQESVEILSIRAGAPRDVIKVLAVREPYASRRIPVGSLHVSQLRTGFHAGAQGGEVHIVADLVDASVGVAAVDIFDSTLRIEFSK